MELKKEIRMEDVSYTYPESDKVILDHAQMLVPVGKSVGVMGPPVRERVPQSIF